METKVIRSVEEFIREVKADSADWPCVWFRGEPKVATPLLPKLYRLKADGTPHDENGLLQSFRLKAPTFAIGPCPDRGATDQWLFLAQHVGLPTRLLDWSESALVGLYFALLESEPVVWLLNAVELNKLSVTKHAESTAFRFPLTWFQYPEESAKVNIGAINIQGAWELDGRGVPLPVAIQPTSIHPRMSVQRSCFTVHGKCKASLVDQVPQHLKRYEFLTNDRGQMLSELRLLGVSRSTVFPDLDGLARELSEVY